VVVKLNDEYRGDERTLADMLIDTPTGAKVPLRAVADVIAGSKQPEIMRLRDLEVAVTSGTTSSVSQSATTQTTKSSSSTTLLANTSPQPTSHSSIL
jgi:multidrug efflux pump subunit AcrB